MWTDDVKRLQMREIEAIFREAARRQRAHEAITHEYGNDLIEVVAVHGDRIADAIALFFEGRRP